MPQFVSKAVAISRKTYQWHLLGLGLRKPEQLERTLTAMAARGWTRCYLLECGGVPTAFMIGYQYRGTYHYVDVGFDPDWEKFSVGTMLHLAVLRELTDVEIHLVQPESTRSPLRGPSMGFEASRAALRYGFASVTEWLTRDGAAFAAAFR